MIIREITESDKQIFNQAVSHPIQSFEWGEFRKKTGIKVVRKGIFEGKKLVAPVQVTIHPIPKTKYKVGYFPKGIMPDENQMKVLKEIGEENKCVMIKMEPNIGAKIIEGQPQVSASGTIDEFLRSRNCKPGRPIFTKYSFQLDLSPPEEKLLAKMQSKTRYNVRLAERKGVKVISSNDENSFKWFLKLLFEQTVKRQGFYAHTPEYFKTMWQVLKPSGMAKLLRAEFEGQTLAVFMVFVFNKTIYYPYGASTRNHKELMAPNLLMWEVIKLGKKLGCTSLDMWGSLGPSPNKKDDWYGFHRFKQGYGGDLVEFIGSYDLVINPKLYPIYKTADLARWKALRAKSEVTKLPFNVVKLVKRGTRTVTSLFE